MSSLVLTVEIIAGTTDVMAAKEIAALAANTDVTVEGKMRGTTMRSYPGDGWEAVLENFKRDERLESNYPQS